MKTINLTLLAFVFVLGGCTSPDAPVRNPHEQKREWKPSTTPSDDTVAIEAFEQIDLSAYVQALKQDQNLTAQVVEPLSQFVLNARFVEDPRFRTSRMWEVLNLFNTAFLRELRSIEEPAALARYKQAYISTVFSGCRRDLRADCNNIDVFAGDARSSSILVELAGEMDAQLDQEIKAKGGGRDCIEQSQTCRDLVEKRYTILAMALRLKKNVQDDQALSFAYLKHARLFAFLMEFWKSEVGQQENSGIQLSYLTEVHGKIFESFIGGFSPTSVSDREFREFVDNFNPWFYSNRRTDLFRYGTRVMFELAANCCLYEKGTVEPSKAVLEAIQETQKRFDDEGKVVTDEFGPSFYSVVEQAYATGEGEMLKRLGMESLVTELRNTKSPFYDEVFFIVDRLFRGHIDTSEALMLMRSVRYDRAEKKLGAVVQTYLRIYLIHMIQETNSFMAKIYNSKNLASDEIFQEAIVTSREITTKWHDIQARFDSLDKFVGSYFKATGRGRSVQEETNRLVQSVNRNIHYLSVYPNMIVMTYYLAKMKGKRNVQTWWGTTLEITADVILDAFFNGRVAYPWFRFGTDPVVLDREMILYSWYYAMSTHALETFINSEGAKEDDGAGDGAKERAKFINLIMTKYLNDVRRELNTKIADFYRGFQGRSEYALMNRVCEYELGESKALPPRIRINVMLLDRMVYTGYGTNSVNGLLTEMLSGTAGSGAIDLIRTKMRDKITYVKTFIDLVEQDLISSGEIKVKGQAHPDLDTVRAAMADLEKQAEDLMLDFSKMGERYFECLARVQEVEYRRQARLIEEERQHLSWVHDRLSELNGIEDEEALSAKVAELNKTHFNDKYRFDRLDGRIYRMSKYDMIMRMKERIEKDIFRNPLESEKQAYGESVAFSAKSRPVEVEISAGLERDDMVTKGTSAAVSYHPDKAEFIRQGLFNLNGKGNSYLQWRGQSMTDVAARNHLRALLKLYLAGGEKFVSFKRIAAASARVAKLSMMSPIDLKDNQDMTVDGRKEIKFFEDYLVEKNSHASYPLYYYTMRELQAEANLALDGDGDVGAAMSMAKVLNNLGVFVFEPSPWVKETLVENYGSRVNTNLKRMKDLYDYLSGPEAEQVAVEVVGGELIGQPMYVENGRIVKFNPYGGNWLVDEQQRANVRIVTDEFIQQSGNLFKTRESLGLEKKDMNEPQ